MATRGRRDAETTPIERPGMRWISGCQFRMGSNYHYPEERRERTVSVEGFWIEPTPVTNRAFARFVAETGYVTVAEIVPKAEDYPGSQPEALHAGSLVFRPQRHFVDLRRPPVWWDFVEGADWRHPQGPDSNLDGLDLHPVVHIAWADAAAYAAWAGLALPTEAEWECAARGGLDGKVFAWGDELNPGGRYMANTWQGSFPYHDRGDDGWCGTSPVGSFPANGFGLYDMIGNVWEWTADWWSLASAKPPGCCAQARAGSIAASDPAAIPRKVIKGGSYLCAYNYCRRYRPAARHPHPVDTSTCHIGFRCIARAAP